MNIPGKSPVPEYLYRYRGITKETISREIDAIASFSIYGSLFRNLNDPMEGIYSGISQSNDRSEFKNSVERILYNKLRKRICAFSEEYDNHLMWAHYAGQSQGICIRYDTKLISSHLKDDRADLIRVKYAKNPISIKLSHPDSENTEENTKTILRYKSLHWKNEREWRMMFDIPDHNDIDKGFPIDIDKGFPIDIGKSISRIYFGTRISSEHKADIIKSVKNNYQNCSFYNMAIDGYTMRFHEEQT